MLTCEAAVNREAEPQFNKQKITKGDANHDQESPGARVTAGSRRHMSDTPVKSM
jgi:hypothetical protein